MKLLILMVMAITAAYAYSWCIRKRDSDGVSSEIAVALGQQANNAAQFFILMTTATVLTLMFPEDLDSPEARRFIGPFLAVSNVAGTSVAITVARGYAETRSEGAQQDANERVCLYIHYALCAFYFVWGVVYPTITFFFLRNSWRRLRLGLFVDAIIFSLAIALLWWFGETRYPPGDAPLHVALLGRPLCALIGAACFHKRNRVKLVALGTAMGLYHIKLTLDELPREEIRRVLAKSGYGVPSASGNVSSSAAASAVGVPRENDLDQCENPSDDGRDLISHHTAKMGGEGPPAAECAPSSFGHQPGVSELRRRRPSSPRKATEPMRANSTSACSLGSEFEGLPQELEKPLLGGGRSGSSQTPTSNQSMASVEMSQAMVDRLDATLGSFNS
jgi:hypothetical protein